MTAETAQRFKKRNRLFISPRQIGNKLVTMTREQFLAQAQLLTDALDDESNLGSLPSVRSRRTNGSSACDDASSSSWATTGPSGVRLDGMSILGCQFWDVHFGMSERRRHERICSARCVERYERIVASAAPGSGGGGGARTKHRLLRANDPLPSDELTRIGR